MFKSRSLVILVLILIFGIAYFGFVSSHKNSGGFTVTTVDAASAINNKSLPDWFPKNLPIDTSTISEQNKLSYNNGSTLYSLAYRSALQLEEIYSTYKANLLAQGYVKQNEIKSPALYRLDARKGNDTVSIIITPAKGYNLIQIAILHAND